jgi:hypothetical protein
LQQSRALLSIEQLFDASAAGELSLEMTIWGLLELKSEGRAAERIARF